MSTFSYTMLPPPPPPRITQLLSEKLFIITIYTYLLKEVVIFFSFNPRSHNSWTSRDPFVFPSCIGQFKYLLLVQLIIIDRKLFNFLTMQTKGK